VFTPDLFGEAFSDRARGLVVIAALVDRPALLRARVQSALQRLAMHAGIEHSRVAAVGHCFGGLAALELARSGAGIGAVVSFHGGLSAREPARPAGDDQRVRARVLVCTGADDPYCPRDQRAAFEDEMTRGGVDWQMHVYSGAQHGFTLRSDESPARPGCAYHERSDHRSWRAMIAFLDESLGAPTPPPVAPA
jgi:dienelactone hydrolase